MKEVLKKFVQEKLAEKNPSLSIVGRGKTSVKNKWYTFHFQTPEKEIYVTCLHNSYVENAWKLYIFDSSMDKERKKEVMLEYPLETFLNRYNYYEVNGERWYFKLTVYLN